MVEVTQGDRDAAAAVYRSEGNDYSASVIADGGGDDWPIVQAFARHRQAGVQQAFAEREVGMIEALKPFAHYYRLNDCEGRPDDDAIEVPIGDLRFAALALAAKGDSRG